MGQIYTKLLLRNLYDVMMADNGLIPPEEIRQTEVTALVDSGAHSMVINEYVCKELGLKIVGNQPGTLANGLIEYYGVAQPIDIHFENRYTICSPLVMPEDNEILLGAIPMQDMDVVLNMEAEQMVVNPLHPDGPVRSLKSVYRH